MATTLDIRKHLTGRMTQNVYLERSQVDELNRRATEEDVSVSHLVRRAVNLLLAARSGGDQR